MHVSKDKSWLFPLIKNKSDFISCIEHKEEMGILDNGDFTVIQYNVEKPDTFDSPETLECRGIVFCNKTGKVLRRPFEKFFNVNQKEFTQISYLDNNFEIVSVLDKLDGTMISPFYDGDDIFWGTKRCSSEFNEFIKSSGIITKELESFVRICLDDEITPVFEYHDPVFEGSCIVIRYPKRFIKLLALRDFETGHYYDIALTGIYQIEVVSRGPNVSSIAAAIDEIVDAQKIEGCVIVLDNGQRVKLKTFWYCERHRLIEFFKTEWMMAKLYLDYLIEHDLKQGSVESVMLWNPSFDGNGDDVVSNMTHQQRSSFYDIMTVTIAQIGVIIMQVLRSLNEHKTRKELGLSDVAFKNFTFKCFHRNDAEVPMIISKMVQQKFFTSNKNYTQWNELF